MQVRSSLWHTHNFMRMLILLETYYLYNLEKVMYENKIPKDLSCGMSQEFIVKVIYHEVLHVFIGNTEAYDHTKIADDYITPMIASLQAWFPLIKGNAEAIAWSGLEFTSAYPQSRRNEFNTINILDIQQTLLLPWLSIN